MDWVCDALWRGRLARVFATRGDWKNCRRDAGATKDYCAG